MIKIPKFPLIIFLTICLIVSTSVVLNGKFFSDVLALLPEAVLEEMYDAGSTSAYSALLEKQFHKGLSDRITFFVKMAEKGAPLAACDAGSYLGDLGRTEEQKRIWEKYALKGDSCSAMSRFYLDNNPEANIKWLALAIRSDHKECRNIRGKKYHYISSTREQSGRYESKKILVPIPNDVLELCEQWNEKLTG